MTTVIVPRRREDFFDASGDPTHRFVRWMELVTSQTNETSEVVEQAGFISSFSPQSQWLQQQIDGLPEFTVDTTGFTTDTTFITTDKVIA